MEADISEDDLQELKNGNKKVMANIIDSAELSGETYIPCVYCGYNANVYNGDDDEINFIF